MRGSAAWRLDSHVGIAHRVSIVVEEVDDTMVTVKVGGNPVEQLVPRGSSTASVARLSPPTTTAREREDFYQRVLDAIERGLGHERDLSHYMAEGRHSLPQGGAGA